MTIDVYVDGSCVPNPGQGGWMFCYEKDGTWVDVTGHEDEATNNQMKLIAAIRAIEHFPKGTKLRVLTNSKYVQDGASNLLPDWKTQGWNKSDGKPIKNQELWMRLDKAARTRTVDWEWARVQDGKPGSKRAQQAAQGAVGLETVTAH